MRRLLAVVVGSLAACGGEDDRPADLTAAVDTVQGIEHWSYTADPGPALRWSTDTVAVIGDALAEDAYQFDEVTTERLAGDDAGNLYVLDRQGSRVLKYGPDGVHLATYGRKGEGPGELGQPLGLDIGPGDTVWVTDFANSRLTGYPQPAGDPRAAPYPENSGLPSPVLAALEDGFIQSFRPMFDFRGPRGGLPGTSGQGEGDGATPRLPLIRLDPSLAPVDTLLTIPAPPTDMVQLEAGNRVMVMMMPRQFAPPLQWAALSDGTVVVSDTAAYLLRLIAPDGAVRRVIRRAPDPRPVTESDRELARQRLRDAEGGGGTRVTRGGSDDEMRRRLLEQRLEKMTFASTVPRVVSLRVDPLDRIWVGVTGEVADSLERIDVYARDGRLIGELRDFPMPDVFLGEDRVGFLRRDDLDVQQVVIVRLNPPRRS